VPPHSLIAAEALDRLERWLRDNHQVVSASTLAELGVPRHYAASRVRSGRWQRVHEGVFVAHAGELTYLTRCAAALVAAGPTARLDADSAAIAHGVETNVDRKHVYLLLPRGGRRRSLADARVRYSDDALSPASMKRQRMATVSIDTAFVVMARRRPSRARGLLSFAVQNGHTTAERLRGAVLGAADNRHRRQLLLALDDIIGGTRTELEGIFLDSARRDRLPIPVRNYPLRIGARRVWLDLCYPELRIAIEIDGKAYHVLAEDWEDDLDRQNDLILDGWLVLRFTARALRDDAAGCMERVRQAIALRTPASG
jgi:very-short-patch-repair endonuclease